MPGLDDFCLSAICSAAFDVTSEARWCDQKKRFGDAAVMRAEKLVERVLARNQAASGEEGSLLPLLRYWRMRRNAIFLN